MTNFIVKKPLSIFKRYLSETNTDPRGRRWIYIPYDQLNDKIGPLSREDPKEIGIVLIENLWKAKRRPYHKQKLALFLANQRHFALEQASRGVSVRYVWGDAPYHELLQPLVQEFGPIRVMRPAEHELRADLAQLNHPKGLVEIVHEGWLTTAEQFRKSHTGPPWRMDSFYRFVRRATGILMKNGKPDGGKFSFDPENRLPWKGKPSCPELPVFSPDEITQEAIELVQRDFSRHPGKISPASLPASLADLEKLWSWAKRECLPMFGPFEDAMSRKSRSLFHARISSLLNLHRLLPSRVVLETVALPIKLASKEGFIRQILGWREFMHHVHEATDGFRNVRSKSQTVQSDPGSAGFETWTQGEWKPATRTACIDGGALVSELGAGQPLPPVFWGKPSGISCLDTVVREVWEDAYGHHITRLMVLSNIATLLDVSPRQLADWFWVAYSDAYDWVVEGNVLGMGTFGLGDLFTTKPYVSGAGYIHRMSDYCESCEFDPKKNCPLTPMYWSFLQRHKGKLQHNVRLAMPYRALETRPVVRRKEDLATFHRVRKLLAAGEMVKPIQNKS